MRVQSPAEINISTLNERPVWRWVDDPTLSELVRDWGVEIATDCECAGLVPMGRIGDEPVRERPLLLRQDISCRRSQTRNGGRALYAFARSVFAYWTMVGTSGAPRAGRYGGA